MSRALELNKINIKLNPFQAIPVDVAINGLIAIAHKEGITFDQGSAKPKDIPVYNVTCSESKKLTWGTVINDGKRISYEYPFEAGVWYPDGQITTNKLSHLFTVVFFHWLPAYLIDFIMLILGQKRL